MARKAIELATILIDRNETANESPLTNVNFETDFESSLIISDLLLSRKILSQSTDQYSVVTFGSTGISTVRDFGTVDFKALEELKEIKPGVEYDTSFVTAIQQALTGFDQFTRDALKKKIAGRTILLLSNLKSADEKDLTNKNSLKLASMLSKEHVDLIIGSPDILLEDKSSAAFQFIQTLASQASVQWLSFSECYTRFEDFNPRQTQPRGQPFELELGPEVKVKVQMYVKNTNLKQQWKYDICDSRGKQFTKHFHFKTNPDVKVSAAELDNMPDEMIKDGTLIKSMQGRVIEKRNLIKGYRYGKDYIPVTDLDREDFVPKPETKQLKLIQFSPKENILPQYLMKEARYFLPYPETEASQKILMEMANDLIAKKLVMLCRYAYSAAAHPKVACLLPKISKTGVPVFIHYILPFGDECRNFEFPQLEDNVELLSDYQQDAMDDFVDNMMLKSTDFKLKILPEPKFMHECELLKHKALNPNVPLPGTVDLKKSIRHLSRPEAETEQVVDSIMNLADAFPLQIDPNTKSTHFIGRTLGQQLPMEILEQVKKQE
ncbi:unnamed protein product [Bursaphelenchus okinawaensis]|uniref:Ku domain-containing protein n=1 Tax=Bursaphelenchus okinawaensis TaxID=465554 RepID=A0A811K9M0_9BILA|nr:unnamed protein product [Bursaphelenchus okinawaensis]CAG9098028.1 unnamed protein product [Bursaphelenchus okinawaensis]